MMNRNAILAAVFPLVGVLVFSDSRAELQIKPDSRLTPGDAVTTDVHLICRAGYAEQARGITDAEKRQVFRLYGIGQQNVRRYEIDHLISVELGGSNALRNLWPQPLGNLSYNTYRKDELEHKLHELVCAGELPIRQAQGEIASDWIAAYKKYIGPTGASKPDPAKSPALQYNGDSLGQ